MMTIKRTAVGELWALARGRRRRFRVEGNSMLPTLEGGSFLIVDHAAAAREAIVAGDVVVVEHPSRPLHMVKRVSARTAAEVEVASDNPDEGTDSRQFGPLPVSSVVGVVTRVLEWPFSPPPPAPRR